MPADPVRVERRACIAKLTLNRPAARNALDGATVDRLAELIREAASDPGVRVVELGGAGSCFCAGADLRGMRGMSEADPAANLADARRFANMLHELHQLPKPTVARVQGAAVGGGVGLVACCDIAVASEDAFFRLSEVRLGLVPATVGPYLVEAMGPRTARRLMLTGERWSARQARRWGLVQQVVPSAELDRATTDAVQSLLRGAPGAQAACKALLQDLSVGRPASDMRDLTARALADRRSSEEARTGLRAFFAKARPPWARSEGGRKECVR